MVSDTYEIDEGDGAQAEVQVLPLDAWHRANGARMVEFAGWTMPVQYEGIIAEHAWTREHAGLFDVSHMGQLAVSGEGAADALESLMPGDFSALGEGRIRYSLLLAEDGGILDDLMVTNCGDAFHLVVNAATKWDDVAHLREHLPDEITLNIGDDRALLALQGPESAAVLDAILPGAATLRFMEHAPLEWGSHRLGVSRSGYTGEDGFEISVRIEDVGALADALAADSRVRPVGLGARDSLRLEAGLPLYGHDISDATDPVSAGLAFAISKRRRAAGGFPGADRILDLLAGGTPQRRVGIAVEGRMAAREGSNIYHENKLVGVVTSGGFAPTLGRPIAMGYVDASCAGVTTPLEIEVRGKRHAATVVPLPFVPHRYHR